MVTQAQCDEAKDALHQLLIGQRASVVVDRNGERVHFTEASIPQLRRYISECENQLAQKAKPACITPYF